VIYIKDDEPTTKTKWLTEINDLAVHFEIEGYEIRYGTQRAQWRGRLSFETCRYQVTRSVT